MVKCPHDCNKQTHCWNACISRSRRMPILDCDYFQHKERIKVFRVKRKVTPSSVYTSSDVGRLLEVIMSKLGGNVSEIAREGVYEVYYRDMFVRSCNSLSEAEQFKADNFKNLDFVVIKRKGE